MLHCTRITCESTTFCDNPIAGSENIIDTDGNMAVPEKMVVEFAN
jgi:hypothetical protein